MFDFARAGIVALDEIAVIAIHETHEFRQLAGGMRMERTSERGRGGRKLGDDVGNLNCRLFQPGRFEPADAFDAHSGRSWL
jgi:hypothetical protein